MRVVYLAAGAAGMICGSCIRDNRLVATLREMGRDVLLVPLYTPLRTDEADVSESHVYYGGISVYLEQKFPLYRWMPRFVDRLLDQPWLLRRVTKMASSTPPEALGALTVSILRGAHGQQRREVDKLIDGLRRLEPDLVNLPNLMFVGIAAPLRDALGVPVVVTLGGEDIFLDSLPEPFRSEADRAIAAAAGDVDAYIAATRYYGERCVTRFGLPRDRVHPVPLGVTPATAVVHRARDDGAPFELGYLARVCPEKGLLEGVRAVAALRRRGHDVRLRAAGYLEPARRDYLDEVTRTARELSLGDAFAYLGELSHTEKGDYLASLHALSVPTVYAEAKGLYVLEAMASGVPVVQPRHGSFPELIDATAGGLLYDPADVNGLHNTLEQLIHDEPARQRMGRAGAAAVRSGFTDRAMAEGTWAIYERCVQRAAEARA